VFCNEYGAFPLFLVMRLSFLTIVFFLLGLPCWSQERQLSLFVQAVNGNCDSTQKSFFFFKPAGEKDSLFFRFSTTNCAIDQTVSWPAGTYRVLIVSDEGGTVETTFSIHDSSTVIRLGNLMLLPDTATIEEVTITGVPKKFIVVDAEKTTVTVEGNPILEVASVYDAVLKIPGILPFPGGGFAMGGQQASVYFEGIPSNLGGQDLDNLLKSMPATTVKEIVLISNPGASYDATTSGAIIDIVSQGRVTKWLSGSISLNTGINEQVKSSPSFLINGKGKKFTWQVQSTYAFYERTSKTSSKRSYQYFTAPASYDNYSSERSKDHYASIRPSLTYRINRNSFVQFNLGFSRFVNNMRGSSFVESTDTAFQAFNNYSQRKGNGFNWDASMKYRLILDSLNRKLEVMVSYSKYDYFTKRLSEQIGANSYYHLLDNTNANDRLTARIDHEYPMPKFKAQVNVGVKWSGFLADNTGFYRLNDTTVLTFDSPTTGFTLPFHYADQNSAAYLEYKQRIGKKVSLTAGLRAEDYRLKGEVADIDWVNKHYTNLFPSIHALYRITGDILFTASYARKINVPYYTQFDPNLSGYYDVYTQSTGNANLEPNFNQRMHAKFTVFEYLEFSANYNIAASVNLSEVRADSNSYSIDQTYRTYTNVQSINYFMSIPIPFGMFKYGLDFFNQAVDVDAISFLYVYADNQRAYIPNYDYPYGNLSQWSFGCYSQFILPWKWRLNADYNYTAKGVFQITETTKAIHDLEMTLSKEFKEKHWRIAFTVQDVLNSNRYLSRTSFAPVIMESDSKPDTRVFWIKLAYSFGRYERPNISENGLPNVGGGKE
jgi:iron complex outermembrane receptor protein